MNFHNPWVLFLIPAAFIFSYIIKRQKRPAGIKFSSVDLLPERGFSVKIFISENTVYIKALAITLMLMALARPQDPVKESLKRREGIDIVLTVDVSTSMLAEDFNIGNKRTSRMEIVKKVVSEFIPERRNDRMAIVVFGARPYTVSPLTLNHDWLVRNMDRVYAGMLEDRTAIGSALAASLKRLGNSKAKEKVIILLTDGKNNAGDISPMTATDLAKALNVKIYTIGAGTYGTVPYPVRDKRGAIVGYENIKLDIDEDLLRNIASGTGGRYYRATDTESLKKIYEEIDTLEKVPIQEKGYSEYNELFTRFLVPGLALIILAVVLSNAALVRIP